jgi:DNA-binding MarR family transcriptional regulator
LIDHTPEEAVAEAMGRAGDDPRTWERLDRYLRWRTLEYLQNREGDVAELRRALATAVRWARSSDRRPHSDTWAYLMELLQDAEAVASQAEELAAVEGRAAELLRVVAAHGASMRPRDLREQLGISDQHVNNLVRKLECSRLVVRQRRAGRATFIFPTARGVAMARSLQGESWGSLPKETVSDDELVPDLRRETVKAAFEVAFQQAVVQLRADQSPRPGDLFVFRETFDGSIEWAIIDRDPEDAQRFLAAPVDDYPQVGSCDIGNPLEGTGMVSNIRCDVTGWLDASLLEQGLRTGTLPPIILNHARRKREEIEKETLVISIAEEEVDGDPEYRRWKETERKHLAALAEAAKSVRQQRFIKTSRSEP